jgi:Ni/Co efflux regulator RcnB
MKKLLIATLIGTMSATMALAATDAVAQTEQSTHPAHPTHSTPAKKKTGKAAAPKHRIVKRKSGETTAKVDSVPVGSVEWDCNGGLVFDLKGDMKRDQIVTVHWANKNYNLPRETTTTGADRFHDAATGLDLVVIPTKAMLFSDNDGARLADECKTADMVQGAPAPTQANALKRD